MAKAEAAERALRLLSSSRQDETTMPLLKEKRENSAGRETEHWYMMNTILRFKKDVFTVIKLVFFVNRCWKKSHFAMITGLLSNRGQQRAKTRAARCVLQLVLWRCTIHHVCFTPSSSSAHPGAVWENMHIVAKVQGFLPPTHTSHWLPLHPAPWEANTLGMNWLPTGWMLPLYAAYRGLAGCGCFYLFVFYQDLIWP